MNKNRLKRLAVMDTNKMCYRYESECRDLGSHMETAEEKADRLKRNECRKKHLETWTLHTYTAIK